MKNYQKDKNQAVKEFYKLLTKARKLVSKVSKGTNIDLTGNGVTFVMIDPFADWNGEMSEVERVENGDIYLENGTVANVNDVTNLTDLIGLLETIDN